MKWLAFNGLIEMEKGMRAEKDNKTALTVTYRKRDMLFGLVGGKCEKCGTVQFPRTRICVNPNCRAVDEQKPFSFAELQGKILSWSADYLTYSPRPAVALRHGDVRGGRPLPLRHHRRRHRHDRYGHAGADGLPDQGLRRTPRFPALFLEGRAGAVAATGRF